MKLAFSNRYIKMFMLYNFDERKSVRSTPPSTSRFIYPGIFEYLASCQREIISMKAHKVKGKYSLHDVLVSENIISIGQEEGEKILGILEGILNYPVYKDMIYERVNKGIERGKLLLSLSNTQVFTCSTDSNCEERIVKLDQDSVYTIARYLSNKDLLSFTRAFNYPA